MYEILGIVSLLLSGYLLARMIGSEGRAEFFLILFCIVTAEIALWGYLLSAVDYLGDVRAWAVLGTTIFVLLAGTAMANRNIRTRIEPDIDLRVPVRWVLSVRNWYREETSTFEKVLLLPLIFVTVLIGALNLAIIIYAAPHNFDSMTYRLARMAYYIQQNNLDYYPANFWAQVIMAKNSALFLIYSYLMSGENENMTQLVQFIAYWVSVCSVYGIARRTGSSRTHSVFAALVSALLVQWLLESITTQNDIIVAAYFGSAIYFLFAFRDTLRKRYLILAALGIGLSFGASAKSFFPLPSAFVVACYLLYTSDGPRKRIRNFGYFIALALISVSLLALPAGYVENYQNFGNPIGPEEIRQYSFEGKPITFIVSHGAKNVLRFGFEFLSLDGLLPFDVVSKAQSLLTAVPKAVVESLGLDLESPDAVIKPFRYKKPLFANEDWHAWGIFGFALIWIMVLLSAAGVVKSRDKKILSYAAIVFPFTVAFAGYYEPHLIRYFAACAIFATPPVALAIGAENRLVRAYLLVVVMLGCLSAVSAIVLRANRPPFSITYKNINLKSVFQMNRMSQLTTNNIGLYGPLRLFERLVPKDATVAVFLPEDTYEYPLFGKYLTRTIIPINSFVGGFQSIPADADYLLYVSGFPHASANDLRLGAGWRLRRLSRNGEEVIEFFKTAVRLRPENASYHNKLGIQYFKYGLKDNAIAEFEAAVRLAPSATIFRSNLDNAIAMKNASAR